MPCRTLAAMLYYGEQDALSRHRGFLTSYRREHVYSTPNWLTSSNDGLVRLKLWIWPWPWPSLEVIDVTGEHISGYCLGSLVHPTHGANDAH